MEFFTQDYLMHHGVKGQKWGVRRYQNKDGSRIKSSPPNTSYLYNYSGPAFFISTKSDLKRLDPRVPKNFFTQNGYEDATTPRVSFAPSIGECLAGLSQNVDKQTFYVYSPDDVKNYKVFKPNTTAVPDSKITNELWITEPVNLTPISKITVTGNRNENGKVFSYGKYTAELYDDWTYDETPLRHSAYKSKEIGMEFFTQDYLEHHGIDGQKWGIRRYQNKDGSLTPAGRLRYLVGKVKKTGKAATEKVKVEKLHEDYSTARKPITQMSDAELKKAKDRLQLESEYRTEYAKTHKETTSEYIKRVSTAALKKHGEKVAEYLIGKAINAAFGDEVIKGLGKNSSVVNKDNTDMGKAILKEMEVLKRTMNDISNSRGTDSSTDDSEETKKPSRRDRIMNLKWGKRKKDNVDDDDDDDDDDEDEEKSKDGTYTYYESEVIDDNGPTYGYSYTYGDRSGTTAGITPTKIRYDDRRR